MIDRCGGRRATLPAVADRAARSRTERPPSAVRRAVAYAGRATHTPWPAILLITAAGLALRTTIPALVKWSSPHDDEALMRIAASIMKGDWLGPWGAQQVPHITLAKGPGYPLFLAAIHWTGLGPTVAAYLLYLGGALLLAVTLRSRLGPRWFVALYGLLALNPVTFSTLFSQVYRDQLVTALSLLSLGLGVHLATLHSRRGPWSWFRGTGTVVETLALGMVTGWLAITRGDVVWITLATAGGFLVMMLAHAADKNIRTWLRAATSAVVVALLAWGAPFAVAQLNARHYGVPLVDDYSQGGFAEALTLWASVKVEGSNDLIPVSAAQRAAVYEVSPTARTLRDRLEVSDTPWIARGCSSQQATGVVCDDYGAYFTWAIRDAVIQEHRDATAEQFQDVFLDIADEIDAACRTGGLTCGTPGLSPDVPPLDRISKRAVLANLAGQVNGAFNYFTGTRRQALAQPGTETTILWTETVNQVGTPASLAASGNQPTTIAQTSAVALLSSFASWLMFPMAFAALVGAFTRRMWTSTLGRLSLVALAGWLTNLLIVSIFFAGANRTRGDTIQIYTMASQSFLLTGLVLAAVVMSRALTQRFLALVAASRTGPDGPGRALSGAGRDGPRPGIRHNGAPRGPSRRE